jgi:hypothetical protein
VGGGVLLFGGASAVWHSSGWSSGSSTACCCCLWWWVWNGWGVGWWGVSARCWVLRDQAVDSAFVGLVWFLGGLLFENCIVDASIFLLGDASFVLLVVCF